MTNENEILQSVEISTFQIILSLQIEKKNAHTRKSMTVVLQAPTLIILQSLSSFNF